jgi:hypothetical protein
MRPFVIALYTGKGIPMLWNGQEFWENWGVPNWGIGGRRDAAIRRNRQL